MLMIALLQSARRAKQSLAPERGSRQSLLGYRGARYRSSPRERRQLPGVDAPEVAWHAPQIANAGELVPIGGKRHPLADRHREVHLIITLGIFDGRHLGRRHHHQPR